MENGPELNPALNSNTPWEKFFSEHQRDVIEQESEIAQIAFTNEGLIDCKKSSEEVPERLSAWKQREGVLTAEYFNGIIIVVFNSNIKVPEGCRNLQEITSHGALGRAGEYDPEEKICFIDICNTYDFLEERYAPEWENQTLRHELRHALVDTLDNKYRDSGNLLISRYDNPETKDEEQFLQLTYLDELHSAYFDVIEESKNLEKFDTFDNHFYSVAKEGSHREISSNTIEGQREAEKLFQLLKRSFELIKKLQEENKDLGLHFARAVGSFLATSKNLQEARENIENTLNAFNV